MRRSALGDVGYKGARAWFDGVRKQNTGKNRTTNRIYRFEELEHYFNVSRRLKTVRLAVRAIRSCYGLLGRAPHSLRNIRRRTRPFRHR